MLGLFINTVDPQNKIFLVRNGKILGQSTWKAHQNEANKLLPALQKLLQTVKKKWTDLTHILVVQGPGKFTSTRIGITVANTLAHELKIPVRGIDRLEMIMRRLYEKNKKIFPLNVYIESERGDFFIAHYKDVHQTLVKLIEKIKTGRHIVLYKDGSLRGHFQNKDFLSLSKTVSILFSDTKKFTSSMVVPLYVRGANITQRKKR
jgi:tRNA threonylcarbamoyl adenosine modification protein YeaZ